MTLTEFLQARIAEDEAVARAAVRWNEGCRNWADAGEPDWVHIARWDPARVLAECEAKRSVVHAAIDAERNVADAYKQHPRPSETTFAMYAGVNAALQVVTQCLAFSYADHPDYDESWRP
jgi:inorganic pyrophosphatase